MRHPYSLLTLIISLLKLVSYLHQYLIEVFAGARWSKGAA